MNIKNIIFDLGGVVIDLDRKRAVKALEKLGIKGVDEMLGEYGQQGVFYKLEAGEISASDFFDFLIKECKEGTTCTDIQNAFEEFLVDIPSERLEMLDKLKEKGYNLYVLSNTNPVMFNHWIDLNFRKEGKSINDYFKGIVTSFQEGLCKPDPSLFQKVIDRYGLNPEETIMLDDSQKNVEAARSVGLNAIRIMPKGSDSFIEVTEKLL